MLGEKILEILKCSHEAAAKMNVSYSAILIFLFSFPKVSKNWLLQ